MLELKKISKIVSGMSLQTADDQPHALFVRMSDLTDIKAGRTPTLASGRRPSVARALTIKEGDVVVGARGNFTEACVAESFLEGAFVSLDLYLVRPNRTHLEPHYLVAFLELPETQALLSAGKQGSGLARLAKEALENTEIPLPPLDQQRLIAALAQSFQHKARLLKQLAELNTISSRETLTRAIRAADR